MKTIGRIISARMEIIPFFPTRGPSDYLLNFIFNNSNKEYRFYGGVLNVACSIKFKISGYVEEIKNSILDIIDT